MTINCNFLQHFVSTVRDLLNIHDDIPGLHFENKG